MKLDIQMFSTPYVVFEDIPSTETPIDSTSLNKIQTDCRDEIGSLSLLETTDKSNLVSAINENKRNIDEGGGGGGIVALKSITTEPSTFDTGDKYYDAEDDLIYTATSSSTWNEGEEPKVTSLYLNEADNHLYRYYDNQMNIEAGGETLPIGSEIDFDGVNVPTGWEQVDEIIESGSNANGNYVKYADGTMICYGEKSGDTTWSDYWSFCKRSPDSESGALALTFPQTFTSTPIAQLTGSHTGYIFSANVYSVSTTTLKVILFKPTSVSNNSYKYSWLAIGKWK